MTVPWPEVFRTTTYSLQAGLKHQKLGKKGGPMSCLVLYCFVIFDVLYSYPLCCLVLLEGFHGYCCSMKLYFTCGDSGLPKQRSVRPSIHSLGPMTNRPSDCDGFSWLQSVVLDGWLHPPKRYANPRKKLEDPSKTVRKPQENHQKTIKTFKNFTNSAS